MKPIADIHDKLKGCLYLGALGDALGSRYEGRYNNPYVDFGIEGSVTDDTQLTLATCEAVYNSEVSAEKIAASFLTWYNAGKLSGLGASTLKALRELRAGGHWALVGRSGEYAAGNGAAMRIAPLAFKEKVDRQMLRDVCSITHKNDEAYTGALAVYYAVRKALTHEWKGGTDLIDLILDDLPDMQVRERLTELSALKENSIADIGKQFKPGGYVVDSVPIAIFAAQKIADMDAKQIFHDLITVGGDTDTICSMAGQIIGAFLGYQAIPGELKTISNELQVKEQMNRLVDRWQV